MWDFGKLGLSWKFRSQPWGESPLHFHRFAITVLKVFWINFPGLPLRLPSWNWKCFNHVHVQKRVFTKLSVFLERVSLLNPRVRTNFVAFPLERTTGKSLEVRFDFGPRPGFSKQLFGSSREGTELDRTYLKQFLWNVFELPCPSFPWCFCFLGVFPPGNFLGLFECFLLVLQGFWVFARFAWCFRKDQGKEGQGRKVTISNMTVELELLEPQCECQKFGEGGILEKTFPWSSIPWCLGNKQGKPSKTARIFYPSRPQCPVLPFLGCSVFSRKNP